VCSTGFFVECVCVIRFCRTSTWLAHGACFVVWVPSCTSVRLVDCKSVAKTQRCWLWDRLQKQRRQLTRRRHSQLDLLKHVNRRPLLDDRLPAKCQSFWHSILISAVSCFWLAVSYGEKLLIGRQPHWFSRPALPFIHLGVGKWVVIHVITWITSVATIEQQTRTAYNS